MSTTTQNLKKEGNNPIMRLMGKRFLTASSFVMAAAASILLSDALITPAMFFDGSHIEGTIKMAYAFAPSPMPPSTPEVNSLTPVPPFAPPTTTTPNELREDGIGTEQSITSPQIAPGPVNNNNNNNNVNTSLYENQEYGIQLRYPQNWFYLEGIEDDEDDSGFDFGVAFAPAADVSEAYKEQQSGGTPEVPPAFGVNIGPLPERNMDLQDLKNIFIYTVIDRLMSDDHEIISTNSSAMLSGIPAVEVVAEQPKDNTREILVMTIQDDKFYLLTYRGPEPKFEGYLPEARDMFRSFTIA